MKYNAGFDLNVWRNIIDINFDAYLERTQNLLVNVDVAPSTGFTSYTENVGQLDNKGIEVRARFNLINRPDQELNWNVTLSAAHERDKIRKISGYSRHRSGFRPRFIYLYIDFLHCLAQLQALVGHSREICQGREGLLHPHRHQCLLHIFVFIYSMVDKVEVGNTTPKLQGYINSNLNWKGFNLYFSFNY